MSRYNPAGTAHNPSASGPKSEPDIVWSHEATDWLLATAPPIRRGDTIYAVGNGLLALDSDTGERKFGYPGPYQSAPARAEASAYRTDTLAVTASSGVFGLNADGGIDIPLVNRSLGAERWAGPRSPGSDFFGPTGSNTPVVADGGIYTAIPGTNSVVALDPNDGSVVWRNTHHEDDAVSAAFNRPAVRDGLVFVTNWPRQVTAYRADSGEREWRRELDEQMILAPAATEAGLVVPTRTGVVLLDTTDGTTRWNRSLDGNMTEGAPAVADGIAFVADERASLHALDLATGETVWTLPFEGWSSPVVANGVVYAVRSGVSLVGYRRRHGGNAVRVRAVAGPPLDAYRRRRYPLCHEPASGHRPGGRCMTTEPNEGSTGTPPNSTDRREARETVLSVVRTAGTRIRRDPALAVPFAVAGVVVALADWLRRRGPVPFARPGWFGDTVSVQYSMFPSGTARTIRYVDALVDLREPYLLGAVALELAAWLAVGIAGWLTVVRALNAEHRSRPLLRYLSVSVVVGVLPALFGPSTVEFDALPIGLLVLFVSALVATSLFLVPGTVVTGYPVATALRESVRRSRGRRWSLLGLVACFGLASWGLARVPVAGGFLSTAVVGPIHAVSLAVLLRKNG